MNPQDPKNRWLDIEEVRLVSDLRIMHSKVDELCQVVNGLKERHDETAIVQYADQAQLDKDIARVDQIYLWYVRIKELVCETRKLKKL